MEPEVHIIEKYFQEILHCFTMTNIRCRKGKEIDLLAINPKTGEKYHVESRIGTSPSFRIREKDTYTSNGRPHKIGLDYFAKEKFDNPIVTEKILEVFGDSNYHKVLVVWDVQRFMRTEEIAKEKFGIEVVFMINLIESLMRRIKNFRGSRDDVLRTLELIRTFEIMSRKIDKQLEKSRKRMHAKKGNWEKLQRKILFGKTSEENEERFKCTK